MGHYDKKFQVESDVPTDHSSCRAN